MPSRNGANKDCERLRGMYAFALWDTVERELWLARDPYGIKPLYFSETGGNTLVRIAGTGACGLCSGRHPTGCGGAHRLLSVGSRS